MCYYDKVGTEIRTFQILLCHNIISKLVIRKNKIYIGKSHEHKKLSVSHLKKITRIGKKTNM